MKRLDVTRPINHRDIERRITPQDRSGPSTAGCIRTYDLRILWNPASGNCTIGVRYNSVTESISFARNATHSAVLALINAHSEFVAASVTASFSGAGSFPSANMVVRLPSGAEIVSHSDTLVSSGGSPVAEFRVDVCGC